MSDDKKFIRNISSVVVLMIVFVIVLVVATGRWHEELATDDLPTPSRDTAMADRIKPVGAVYSGDTGLAALAEAEAKAAESAVVVAAFDGSLDGAMIYNNVCGVCHNIGAGGAPMLQQDAWTDRLAQGNDVLVQHAIEGYQGSAGVMPARGGRMDLTDDQVRASVDYMLDNLQ